MPPFEGLVVDWKRSASVAGVGSEPPAGTEVRLRIDP
jgi:hypothetical protein